MSKYIVRWREFGAAAATLSFLVGCEAISSGHLPLALIAGANGFFNLWVAWTGHRGEELEKRAKE